MKTPAEYELEVMAHRYLYYVESAQVLPDLDYDVLERTARDTCPPESPVHGIGSSLSSSYSPEQIAHALRKVPGAPA